MQGIEPLIYGLGLAGAAVNAASGVLEAGRKPFDLFGMIVVALAAALGGGSLRDMLLDRTVFWIADQAYLITALVAGVATFLLARRVRLPAQLFLLPDAIGLSLFTVVGTSVALAHDAPWLVASLMGVVTGVFGGILRDVLCNEAPVVFGGELYGSAAWLGALVLIGLPELGVGHDVSALSAGAVICTIRLLSIRFKWHLPIYSARR
ncbi:MAG: trimeric intracellular cation channel family protein [Zoogloeaceae bacterium]|uniref:trimeric intracellular cation channel family protein n=1 Tax=Denitromonas sp. TaxID=2734609 RepID=UPI001D20547A|nr:trimeric intracellular cation channel family protein [Rhodocyclaceae bacterium]MCP5223222.1 trimeric intracellular cation channel family protein [Zoogloeaceae bacterium]HPR05239.1 trimeric intracellular cation channel family protein [Denitromonas sp.]HQU88695.1 trimeric intracellular cation channel family protein [Denitromonas sp.]